MLEQIEYTRKTHPEKYMRAYKKVDDEYRKIGKILDDELAQEDTMTLNILLGYIKTSF